MDLVEIVVQGLAGAPELVRLPFHPTITVLPAGARERHYVRIVLDLLYPKAAEPTLVDLADPSGQSRVAVTVLGRDQQRYRLLQDVGTGRRALQRATGDKPETVTTAASEIAQAVTATIGFPQEDVLRELLFCIREDMPSKKPAGAARPATPAASASAESSSKSSSSSSWGDKPLPPGFSDEGAPVKAEQSEDDLRRRLADIDAQLQAAEQVKDVEFEIDGWQKKLFEVEARLRPLSTLRRDLELADEQMLRFHGIESVPDDLPEKAERLRKAQGDHANAVVRFEEERERLVESSGAVDRRGHIAPLDVVKGDPFVRWGVAAGAGAVVLGVLGAVVFPPLQWAAFLDIPAFGAALFGGIRVLGSLEHGESVRRRILRLDAEKKKLDEKLRVDEEHVKSVLARAGFALEQLPDVEEQLLAREQVRQQIERARAALAEAEQGGDVASLTAEQQDIQARIRSLEEQLQGQVGWGAADLAEEKAEIERLLAGGAPVEKEPEPEPAAAVDAAALFGGGVAEDLCKRQLELARDVLMTATVEDVAAQVQPRATQILSALADGRYTEVRFSGRGEASVVDAAAGEPIPFGTLPPFDRDLVFLAVKVALIEIVVKQARLPVVFDRGLDALADTKAPLLKNMLQFLASMTQVVCISEKPALGGRPA